MDTMLTVKEVAQYLGVSEIRVRLYAVQGRLKGVKLGEPSKSPRFKASRRHWRFSLKNVEKFARGR